MYLVDFILVLEIVRFILNPDLAICHVSCPSQLHLTSGLKAQFSLFFCDICFKKYTEVALYCIPLI